MIGKFQIFLASITQLGTLDLALAPDEGRGVPVVGFGEVADCLDQLRDAGKAGSGQGLSAETLPADGAFFAPDTALARVVTGKQIEEEPRSRVGEVLGSRAQEVFDRAHLRMIGRPKDATLCWRRQSRANPSLKTNSLLAGKIQGILFV